MYALISLLSSAIIFLAFRVNKLEEKVENIIKDQNFTKEGGDKS